MPERAPRVARWRLLGRLLPCEVRARVCEPAFADLTYTWLTSTKESTRPRLGARVMGTYLGCFPIAVPRLFVQRGRLTRFSQISLWAVGVLAIVAIVLANVTQSYGSYPP